MRRDFGCWDRHERGGLVYLEFSSWPGVRVLYSTRIGGISSFPFDSLNLHYGRGDKREHVKENRRRFFDTVGIDEDHVVFAKQTHSNEITIIQSSNDTPSGDGMITVRTELYLGIFTADCLGIFLCAPEARIVGLVHAGWKGLAKSIINNGIRQMRAVFNVQPDSIEALCGPSIGPCCYEVGKELRSFFESKYFEEREGRTYLNLWRIAEDQLSRAGIRSVYVPHICTATHSDHFYSYRKSGEMVGENLGLIGMTDQQ